MSYYKIIGFEKEPFSTSPDPNFFYLSKEHERALTNILIELRLKRGLSVVLGDVGTGKTSLSRKLIQDLKVREDFVFHIILDPLFENENVFLASLIKNFEIGSADYSSSTLLDLRESLEKFLFQRGVIENKTVTLIIDEAQKLSESSLEILRVLLNYETNEFKLLQIVLLGQVELHSKIMNIPNFFDRISFKYTLNPLDFDETKEMIEFRLRQAGYRANMHLFLDEAVREIYQHSQGYPRRITMLCHKALKNLVLKNRFIVDAESIKEIVEEEIRSGWHRKETALLKSSY
ncbi:MAG: transposase [Candidatus Omnitrophica bacterium CG07_land_8_20_14_0_80_42_15]|uniref:Transposase n=1 Tax=Candidatus Aquitaenariimonas noxiae TaxID=1974741 RepID=A0A2J0L1W4_9BACT|nr:MAG: transposase [Candidatus Omnitrophica bacterium CG07_land_8_20_14_0_80_42_15]